MPIVIVLDDFVRKNSEEGTLHRFLPRDLAQMAYGYAMMDPVFHNYKFVWTLNNHLNKLGGHVNWTRNHSICFYNLQGNIQI